MTVSLEKLRANAPKLDRLNGKVASVLTAMQRGEALHLEYRWCGPVWCLSGGRHIPNEVARVAIQNPQVVSVGDSLFRDTRPQTYRWVE